MYIQEVSDKKTNKDFIRVPKIIYKDDKNWISPLDMEIENIFNPGTNSSFKHGEAARWILKNNKGKLAGRIAAFYDKRKASNNPQPTGGIGFFECVNDKEAAFLLFDTAKEWLKGKDMQAMDGPVNFGENFFHWGLLVEGYSEPVYGMPYNYPYYRELFESYGFKTYYEEYSYYRPADKPYHERLVKYAEFVANKEGYSYLHFSFKEKEKFINDIVKLYNIIWSEFLKTYTPLKYEDVELLINVSRNLIDEEFIWLAYYQGNPIAFVVAIPDVNQILKSINGKLNLWSIIKLLCLKKRKVITRSRVTIFGVVEAHQRSGVLAALFLQYQKAILKKPNYKSVELAWVGDYNPKMIKVYQQIEATKYKTHITYRYLFDRNARFQRFTNELPGNADTEK
jgi:hypothetical protein